MVSGGRPLSSSGRKVRGTVALAGGVKEVDGSAALADGAEEGGRGDTRRWTRGRGGRRRRRVTRPHCRNDSRDWGPDPMDRTATKRPLDEANQQPIAF